MKPLRDEVCGLGPKRVVSSDSAEMNSTFRDHNDSTSTDKVPVGDLLLMEGKLNGERFRVLKDDGCNTNVVS